MGESPFDLSKFDPSSLNLSHLHPAEQDRIRNRQFTSQELSLLFSGQNPWTESGKPKPLPPPPPQSREPTLDDLRRIAHADTLPRLEGGEPDVRAALEAQWKAANKPTAQSPHEPPSEWESDDPNEVSWKTGRRRKISVLRVPPDTLPTAPRLDTRPEPPKEDKTTPVSAAPQSPQTSEKPPAQSEEDKAWAPLLEHPAIVQAAEELARDRQIASSAFQAAIQPPRPKPPVRAKPKPGNQHSGSALPPSPRKPTDIWLMAGSAIVGIIIYLAPNKSPVVVVLALLAMLLLAIHPLWNFWWIEKGLWRRIASVLLLMSALACFGWYVWPHFFTARLNSFIQLKFPGPLLCVYPSDLGKTLAPTNVAIHVEVVNLKPTKTRIYSYSADAVIETQSGTKTYPLFNVPLSGCEMVFVAGDWAKAKQIDFSANDFDLRARDVAVGEGESVSGWMFFELDPTVRGLDYNIKEIHLTIEDTVRNRETISLMAGEANQLDGGSVLSSGQWKLMAGYYDLSKEHYTLTPKLDLADVLKQHREHPENYPPSPSPSEKDSGLQR